MTDIPVLTTDRTVLRGLALTDFDDFAAMWADPGITRHITGTPSTPSDSWMRLLRHAGHWALLGYGYWAVTDRQSGAFLGAVGFGSFMRDLDPPLGNVPEAGWTMIGAAQGRGLAGEAMGAALDWADRALPGGETVCMISPENGTSLRLAARLGYSPGWTARLSGKEDVQILTRPRRGG